MSDHLGIKKKNLALWARDSFSTGFFLFSTCPVLSLMPPAAVSLIPSLQSFMLPFLFCMATVSYIILGSNLSPTGAG